MNIVLHNTATERQRQWVFAGLPEKLVPEYPGCTSCYDALDSCGFPYVPGESGVWILADMPANTRWVVELHEPQLNHGDEPGFWSPFELHRSIVDIGILNLVPEFWAKSLDGATTWFAEKPQFWPTGGQRPSGAFVRLMYKNDAIRMWHMRTRIGDAKITVDWWARVGSSSGTIEWTTHLVYGDVSGGLLSVQFGEVGFTIGAEPVVDFAHRVNIQPAVQALPSVWRQVLMQPGWWNKASRIEVRGALLTEFDPGRRQGRPIGAVFTGWDGHWLSLGKTPTAYSGANALSASRLATYLNPPAGNMYDQRPACQPKVSGTTGEQPDFGFSSGEEVVTQLSAWAIHDLLYHAQSYAMRPTANKEVNGDPVLAANHPRTVTTNQRPDHRFSAADMLGWPNPVPYSWPGTGYSTGDDQHRSDGILHALYALTRDPALRSIIEDHIEMQKLALPPAEGSVGAPRAVGRVLLANCNQHWLGFSDASSFIDKTIDFCDRNAGFRSIPQDDGHPVRILDTGHEEAKYGWRHPDGAAVRGTQGWQNAIAAGAFLAAFIITGSRQARELARVLSGTCTDQFFYRFTDRWMHVYAMRWRFDDPGAAHPPSSWYPTQPNYDIYTEGAAQRWTLSAPQAFILLADSNDPVAIKAGELVPAVPANWFDARWWAIPRKL